MASGGAKSGVGHLAALNCSALLRNFLFHSLVDTFEVQSFVLSLSLITGFLFFKSISSGNSAPSEGSSICFPGPLTRASLLTVRTMQTFFELHFHVLIFPQASSYYSSLVFLPSDCFFFFFF